MTMENILDKEELELKKMKMRISNSLYKIAADSNFWSQKLPKAVVWRCCVKKVFLEISQNSRENNCA